MNPTSNESSGIKLPSPMSAELPATNVTAEGISPTPETAAAAPERASTPAATAPAAIPTIPMPTLPSVQGSTATNVALPTTNTVVPDVPDDGDLIEKEWVNKAKKIVEVTKDDPYLQSEELTVFKADYMKKRYDKTIKLK